ncbi:hypothetical protein HOO65_060330 [Ceratocystis lukuohia]|uniref:DUF8004 domain-containing protein n=1 Tax=Ceratocystis lukuohia TaxID=2019550 RepID=A0ABR4ME03_9PEZI
MSSHESARARRFGDFMEGRLPQAAQLKRWDGAARVSQDWNWENLQKDLELSDRNGTCLVYLFAQGTSREGPSFRLPLSSLLAARCHPLIERYAARGVPGSIISKNSSYAGYDMWYRENPTSCVKLYMTAPPNADKRQVSRFHLATRNFFAWICRRSLVGDHLGGAIVTLMRTMQQFRLPGTNNIYDLLDFLEEEGYLNMQNLPNHALAILYVSEYFQFREMYIDAFVHCVGMNSQLFLSSEYRYTSSVSQKLIRRAREDYDLRLNKTSLMLQCFLRDEFSEQYLGLTAGARHHMERFRDFLIKFYHEEFGKYPPKSVESRTLVFSKEVYDRMRCDFECLYELLVDDSFTSCQNTPLLAQGGLCTVQSVNSFDLQWRFKPLLHPLPRLPQVVVPNNTRGMSLTSWLSRTEKPKPDNQLVQLSALAAASNSVKSSTSMNGLVQAFCEFERRCVVEPSKLEKKEKLSLVDARKVRWILIYGIYQTLRSVTEPPMEVREIESARYLVAVSTANLPPWKEAIRRTQSVRRNTDPYIAANMTMPTGADIFMSEIQPDIDYLAPKHRNNSAPHALSSHGHPNNSNVGRAMSLGRSFAQGEMFRRLSIFKNPKWHNDSQQNHTPTNAFEDQGSPVHGHQNVVYDLPEPSPSTNVDMSARMANLQHRPSTASGAMSSSASTASRSHSTASNSSAGTSSTVDSYSTANTSAPAISPKAPGRTLSWEGKRVANIPMRRRSAACIPVSTQRIGSSPPSPITHGFTSQEQDVPCRRPRTSANSHAPLAQPSFNVAPKLAIPNPRTRPSYGNGSRSRTLPLRIHGSTSAAAMAADEGGTEWEMYSNIGGHTVV